MKDVAATGPDMMGFIFYPGSPRYMPDHLAPEDLASLPSNIIKTGVFVNESCSEILRIAGLYRLDAIQLHGTEIPGECRIISRAGYPVIKAFRIDETFAFEQTTAYSASCKYFLFDAYGEGFGGNGTHFNWKKLQAYRGTTPFLLSGGIDEEDAAALGQLNHPQLAGFDINSKFETEPGIKDPGKIARFIQTLRS